MSGNEKDTKDDIRSQLSDIQKRLFHTKGDKERKPPLEQTTDQENIYHSTSKSKSSGSKKQKVHLPMVPTIAQPSSSLGQESRGNDMNFVVGLSENLLGECRRLTAENQKYKTKLKEAIAEAQSHKDENNRLKTSRNFQIVSESDLKDRNWELEATVSELTEHVASLDLEKEKLEKAFSEQGGRLSSLEKENDELTESNHNISKLYEDLKSTHTKELSELTQKIEELNDENDNLHLKLANNTNTVKDAGHTKTLLAEESSDDDQDLDIEANLDSVLVETEPVEIPSGDPSNPHLELETLKASLTHSNKTIAKLRGTLLKLRKQETKEKKTPVKLQPIKGAKKLRAKNEQPISNRSSYISPSKRNSRFIILDEPKEEEENFPNESGKWEDFIGDNAEISDYESPSKPSQVRRQGDDLTEDSGSKHNKMNYTVATGDHSIPYLVGSDSDSESGSGDEPAVAISNLIGGRNSSNEKIEKYAKDNNLVLIPFDRYEKLQEETLSEISNTRLIEFAKERGLVPLTKGEYDELVDSEQMKKKLESKGLLTIPRHELDLKNKELSELKQISDAYHNPSEAFIFSTCKNRNMSPIGNEELENLRLISIEHEKPSKDYLVDKANELGLIVSSSSYYDEINRLANQPPLDHLQSKAQNLGSVVLKKEEYDRLADPTDDYLISKIESKDYHVLNENDFNILHKKIEEPSLEHLKEKASMYASTIVSEKELSDLSESAKNPSLSLIESHAENKNHKLIPKDEHEKLKQLSYDPPLNHIKSILEKLGLISLSKSEYVDLFKKANDPTIEHLTKFASEKHYEVIPRKQYENLIKSADNPQLEKIIEIAEQHDRIVVDKNEHDTLVKNANEPDLDHITAKARNYSTEVIATTELLNLRKSVDKPSLEELNERAKRFNCTLVTIPELKEMKLSIEEPSKEYLTSKGEKIGLKVLSQKDYEDLDKLAYNPKLDHIKQTAFNLGHVVIPNEKHENDLKFVSDPSIEFLTTKANNKGFELIEKGKLSNLNRSLNAPTSDELAKKALIINHMLLSKEEYERLRKITTEPEKQDLDDLALKIGLTTITIEALRTLEKTTKEPSLEFLQDKAKGFDMKIISNDEYQSLYRKVTNPTSEELDLYAKSLGKVNLSQIEYDSLQRLSNDPDIDHLKTKLKTHSFTCIEDTKLEELKGLAFNPNKEQLTKKSSELGLHVMEEVEYLELLNLKKNPSTEFLKESSEQKGFVLVDKAQHSDLEKLALSPSVDHLERKASEHGYMMLKKADHESLLNSIEHPSKGFLDGKAKTYNCKLISIEDLERLNNLAYKPDDEHLNDIVSAKGMLLLTHESHSQLSELANNPPLSHIKEHAVKSGYDLVEKERIKELESLVSNPPKEHLEKWASGLSLKVVAADELATMYKDAKNPDLETIEKHSDKLGYKILHRDEYDRLYNPPKHILEEHSERQGHKLIRSDDYDKLHKLARDPDISHVKDIADRKGFDVVDKQTLKDLYDTVNHPSKEFIFEKANAYDCQVIDTHRYDELLKTSKKSIDQLAQEQNKTLLDDSEFLELKRRSENPTVDELAKLSAQLDMEVLTKKELSIMKEENSKSLKEKAEEKNMVIVPKETYLQMVNLENKPSLEFIKEKIAYHDHFVISQQENQEYENLKAKSTVPLSELAKEQGLITLDKKTHEELLDQVAHPSLQVMEKATAANGKIMVDESIYRDIQLKSTQPPLEVIKECVGGYNHVCIDVTEFDLLKRNATKTLDEKAKELNRVVLDHDTYHMLQESASKPSLKVIQDRANYFDKTVIDQKEFENLKSSANETIEDKAKKLSLTVIGIDDLDKLQSLVDESLESRASKERMKVLTIDEYDKLQSLSTSPDLEFLRSHCEALEYTCVPTKEFENPGLDYIEKKANLKSYTLIKTDRHKELEKHFALKLEERAFQENKKLLTTEEYDDLVSPSYEMIQNHARDYNCSILPHDELNTLREKADQSLESKASENNLKLISHSEYNTLKKTSESPSVDFLKKMAGSVGLVLLGSSEHDSLKKNGERTLEDFAAESNSKVLSNDEYDELLVQAHKPSLDSIAKNASANGMTLVPVEQYEELKKSASETIEEKAMSKGALIVDKDEYEEKVKLIQQPPFDYLKQNMALLGYDSVKKEELFEIKKRAGMSLDDVARESGKVVIDESYYNEILEDRKRKIQDPSISDINEDNLSIVKSKLESLNYKLIKNDTYEKNIGSGIDIGEAKAAAKANGYTLVPNSHPLLGELQEFRSASYADKRSSQYSVDVFADAEDSFVLDREELSNSAAKLGLVVIEKDELPKDKEMDEDSLKKVAAELSLAVVPESDVLKLKQQIAEQNSELFRLRKNEEPTKEWLRTKSSELNLVLLEKSEYQELRTESNNNQVNNIEKLTEEANRLGYVLVPREKHEILTNKSMETTDRAKLIDRCKQIGLMCIPETAFVPTALTMTPDLTNVAVLPRGYYTRLLRNDALSIEKVSEEIFKKYASKRGYQKLDTNTPSIPHLAFANNSPTDRSSPDSISRFTPPSSRAWPQPSSASSSGNGRSTGLLTASNSIRSNLSLHSRGNSVHDSLMTGVLSMATNVSLTDTSMIPAITQVVIGEYLFKYYRNVGPFTSITESRHERYFWVHPYSLTLYWSTSNPVLSNPSEVKIRAAAIVGVESIPDNNPLPTGLYHKSIIVRSQNRSIKITCATRQRHNIWFNALRYLINRNMDDLVFDTEEGEGDDESDIVSANLQADVRKPRDKKVFDTGERHAYPRQRVSSTHSAILRTPSLARLSRLGGTKR